MEFNGTNNEKLIDLLLDSTLQITSMKLAFVKFWHGMKEYPQFPEKTIKTLWIFNLHICVWSDFLYLLPATAHIAIN